jgi:MSHA biogenesis protein MshM
MYLKFFGLKEFPFSLTPNTSYFFSYGHYRAALETLVVALDNNEGFIKVTGEVGSGKTQLCRKLIKQLDDNYFTVYIPNPYLTPLSLFQAFAEGLNIDVSLIKGHHHLMKSITRRLIILNSPHKKGGDSTEKIPAQKVVLCIDEAQAMPIETLEAIRLLTNLETEQRKLIHVVLFGQPELEDKLNNKEIRQLKQRITFSYTLGPIDLKGMAEYINHRLLIAGSDGSIYFHPKALKLLHKGSGGYPRLINILAHKSLMLCFGQDTKKVMPAHVRAAVKDTEGAKPISFWS